MPSPWSVTVNGDGCRLDGDGESGLDGPSVIDAVGGEDVEAHGGTIERALLVEAGQQEQILDQRTYPPALVVTHLRGRGIGSAVIDALVSLARTRAVELIEVNVDEGDVDEGDVDAQRFYQRHASRPPSAHARRPGEPPHPPQLRPLSRQPSYKHCAVSVRALERWEH